MNEIMNPDFLGMPEVSKELMDYMGTFSKYLFFTTVKRGVREYFCTACLQEFQGGPRVLKQTMTPADYNLMYATHRSQHTCPLCGESCTVVNTKIGDMGKFSHQRFFAVFLPVNHDDVWFRCFEASVDNRYAGTRGKVEYTEWMRYHLIPGKARFWKKDWRRSEFTERKVYEDPFAWNHGTHVEKYDYWMQNGTDLSIDDTFLKYSAYEDGKYLLYDFPVIRYLCWYAKHPQLEMIVKLKHSEMLYETLYGNSEHVRDIDWSAKKPWDLYRLSHADYNLWIKTKGIRSGCGDMDILKIFHRLKGKGERDFDLAQSIDAATYGSLKKAYNLIARAKRYKTTPAFTMKYLEKVSETSGGGCWHCPGITIQSALSLWLDYLDLAKKAGLEKTVNPYPKDLKAEHDRMLEILEREKYRQSMEEKKKMAQRIRAEAEKDAAELTKKYRKVRGIYAKLKPKYEYGNDRYRIMVPEGIADIVFEGRMLQHCIARVDRYYERIQTHESYLFFLRKADDPDTPYYTLEVEPGATVRQKRTFNDQQNEDIKEATDFLREWQAVVQKRLSAADRKKAKASKEIREREFVELREQKKVVNTGFLRGKLLADVLEADLLEVEFEKSVDDTVQEVSA